MQIRNSAKAIIISEGRLLVTQNWYSEGDWYLLPGGGQEHCETLHHALVRECREEIGAEVQIGKLCLVREYIGKNHEFAEHDSDTHQVEFMFECKLVSEYSPTNGHKPDQYQTGVVWLSLKNLHKYRLYPSVLKDILKDGIDDRIPIYLGDVN